MKIWTINDNFLYTYSTNFRSQRSLSIPCNIAHTHFLVLEKLHHRHLIACYCYGLYERMDWWDDWLRTKDSTSFNLNVIWWSTRPAHDRLTKTANCLLWWVRKSAVSYKSTEKETMWQTCWNIVNFSNVYFCHVNHQRAGNFNQFEVCDENELTVSFEWAWWWGFMAHMTSSKRIWFFKRTLNSWCVYNTDDHPGITYSWSYMGNISFIICKSSWFT